MAAAKGSPIAVTVTAVDRFTGPFSKINAAIARATAPAHRLNAALAGAAGPARALSNQIATLAHTAGVTRLATAFRGVGSAIGDVGAAAQRTFTRIGGLTAGVAAAGYAFKRVFIDAATGAESRRILFEGLEGSLAAGDQAIAFVKRLSDTTAPFKRTDLTDAFAMLRLAKVDPQQALPGTTSGPLQAIADMVAGAGGTGETLKGVALAFNQMFNKERISAEEINQLAERKIPAWDLLRTFTEKRLKLASGSIKTKQLMKAAEQGEFGKREILGILSEGGERFKGRGQTLMKSGGGLETRLANRWQDFVERVMGDGADAGPFARWKTGLQSFLDMLDRAEANGDMQKWVTKTADAFKAAFTWLEKNGLRILTSIVESVKTLAARAQAVADIFGGWGNLITAVGAAWVFAPLLASIASVAAAVRALSALMLTTPGGKLLAGRLGLGLAGAGAGAGALGAAGLGIGLAAAGGYVAYKSINMKPGLGAAPGTVPLPGVPRRGGVSDFSFSGHKPFPTRGTDLYAPIPAPAWHAPMVSLPSGFSKEQVDRMTGTLGPPAALGPAAPLPRESAQAARSSDLHATIRSAVEAAVSSTVKASKLHVDFTNLPKGARIKADPANTAPLDLRMGYAMADR